jgi:hypothetical protein
VCVKGTGKVIPGHAMKSHMVNGGTDAPILTFGTRWHLVMSLTYWSLYPQAGWVPDKGGLSTRAATLSEIFRKIKLNI